MNQNPGRVLGHKTGRKGLRKSSQEESLPGILSILVGNESLITHRGGERFHTLEKWGGGKHSLTLGGTASTNKGGEGDTVK